MTPERWRRIEELFFQAESLAPEERQAYLVEACGPDAELLKEVESLLQAAQGKTASELDSSFVREVVGEIFASARIRQRIGPWEIVSRIGEGGMGVVYLARRSDGAFDMKAALKLVKPGLSSATAVTRFLAERQILAHLAHPNIARLLDGGVTEQGQPWFAMEFVEGEPIDSWRRRTQPDLTTILKLFQAVCAGVQAAHQNLVVHRDIKPANVLVCSDGTPKLVDFGVAKLLDARAEGAGKGGITEQLMTPEYASPEQLMGKPATTATDIFALGVLLYELIVGRRPFEASTRSPAELERMICQYDPPRPSTVIRREFPEQRGLASAVKGELDNIILKAIQKDPARRYSSAAEFAADIQRYLDGFPVLAQPDSLRYRAVKFIGRHKGAVAAAVLFVCLVVGFAISMALLARKAEHERDRAEQISSFLINLFAQTNPDRPRQAALTAREMLDQGLGKINELERQPELQAALLETFGLAYENFGLWSQSRELLQRSLALKRRLYPRDSLEIASTLKSLSELARRQHDFAEAERLIRESVQIRHKQLGERHVLTAESQNTLALILHETGRLREAEQLFLKVLENRDLLHQRDHLETAVLSNLGAVYGDLGELEKAEKYLGECVALRRRELGPNHPRLALALARLSRILEWAGKLRESEAALRESLAIRLRTQGESHPDYGFTLIILGGLQRKQGKLGEAKQTLERAEQLLRRFPDDSDGLLSALQEKAFLLSDLGRYKEAEQLFRSCWRERRAKLGERSLQAARAQAGLAQVLSKQGQTKQARELVETAWPIISSQLAPQHWEVRQAARLLKALAKQETAAVR